MSVHRPRRTHTTDTRVEQGLEAELTYAVGDGEGAQRRGDTSTAARVGNTLEGEASVGKPLVRPRQRRAVVETW